MMENETLQVQDIFQKIKQGLAKNKLKHEIWLYGSFARGQQTPNSDLDFARFGRK